jgi:hypothetical protein
MKCNANLVKSQIRMLGLSRHDVARLLVRPYPVWPFACLPLAHLSVCPPQHRNRINMKAKNSSRDASNCKERKNIRTDRTPSVAGMPAKEGETQVRAIEGTPAIEDTIAKGGTPETEQEILAERQQHRNIGRRRQQIC